MAAEQAIRSSVVILSAALVADTFGVILEAAEEGDAQALLMRAAFAGGNGVAIGGDIALVVDEPADRPFHRSRARPACRSCRKIPAL